MEIISYVYHVGLNRRSMPTLSFNLHKNENFWTEANDCMGYFPMVKRSAAIIPTNGHRPTNSIDQRDIFSLLQLPVVTIKDDVLVIPVYSTPPLIIYLIKRGRGPKSDQNHWTPHIYGP